MCCTLSSCGVFENSFSTTEDGFVYYYDKDKGVCILGLPDSEEVIIPEYINNKKAVQLGYLKTDIGFKKTYCVDGSKVKKLTIQSPLNYYYVNFSNVEMLVVVDYLYCRNFGKSTCMSTLSWLVSSPEYVSYELAKLKNIELKTRNEKGYTNETVKKNNYN